MIPMGLRFKNLDNNRTTQQNAAPLMMVMMMIHIIGDNKLIVKPKIIDVAIYTVCPN